MVVYNIRLIECENDKISFYKSPKLVQGNFTTSKRCTKILQLHFLVFINWRANYFIKSGINLFFSNLSIQIINKSEKWNIFMMETY